MKRRRCACCGDPASLKWCESCCEMVADCMLISAFGKPSVSVVNLEQVHGAVLKTDSLEGSSPSTGTKFLGGILQWFGKRTRRKPHNEHLEDR